MSLLLFKTVVRLLQWLPGRWRIFLAELLPSDPQSPPAGELCCPDSVRCLSFSPSCSIRAGAVLVGSEGRQHRAAAPRTSLPGAPPSQRPAVPHQHRLMPKGHGAAPRLISVSTGRANEDTKLCCLRACPALTRRSAVPPLGAPSRTQCTALLLCHFLGTRAH